MEQTTGVRQLIDPEGTLPEIEVVPQFEQEYEGSYHDYDIRYLESLVGFMQIHRSWCETDFFEAIKIDQGIQKGLGLATYVWAIEHSQEQGRGFFTGSSVSESARKIWEILANRGAAEVVVPFTELQASDGVNRFTVYDGYYFVAAPAVTSTD